jgi:hypothetical protein
MGPLLGYFADGRSRFTARQFVLAAVLLTGAAGAAFIFLPRDPANCQA